MNLEFFICMKYSTSINTQQIFIEPSYVASIALDMKV